MDYYVEDIPAPSSLTTELHIWTIQVEFTTETVPYTPAEALRRLCSQIFIAYCVGFAHYLLPFVNASAVSVFFAV